MRDDMKKEIDDGLLRDPLRVINIGLEGFAADLDAQGIAVTQVDWTPPAGGDVRLADILSKLGT